ncbi:MAG TPA: LysR substrate-binding domain-containing protein [Xanthobacteraceae bacterium]|jgi:DNA-binding transcriptional LysR family regulator|nr:LysR substrate-binding domain-containing protein [Xanthobacteraceae bacterium]
MLDPVLLQTFLAIAQTRSFTQAAARLGLRQSTVSQHIRKLEEEAGRRLFVRDTHSVTPTADGEAMIEFARGILAANERAERYFAGSQLRGRLRFGASEDFVASLLPAVLREFVRTHPLVEFELTVGMSGELNEKLERGELDLVCGKRRPGDDRGRVVWRDRLVWVAGDGRRLDPSMPVPLILYSPPSIMREIALAALERSGRAWRIACTSGSLSGLRAAALAGLGVTVVPEGLIPAGLVELPSGHGLPDLGSVEFVLLGAGKTLRGPAAELADAILASGIRV